MIIFKGAHVAAKGTKFLRFANEDQVEIDIPVEDAIADHIVRNLELLVKKAKSPVERGNDEPSE